MEAVNQVMEHRWGSRIPVNTAAVLRTAEGFASQGIVKNVSISGAYVEGTTRLSLLSRVTIRAASTRDDEWMTAWVVRVEDTGIALEWFEPGMDAVSAFLASNSAAAAGYVQP